MYLSAVAISVYYIHYTSCDRKSVLWWKCWNYCIENFSYNMCFNIYKTFLNWIVTNLRNYNFENKNKRQNDRVYVPKTLKALKTSMFWIFLQCLSQKVIKTENVSCH